MAKTQSPEAERLLTPQELADLCQVPLDTVQRWRYVRSGPVAIRVGKHVRYRMSDVTTWLDNQVIGRR